MNESSKESSIIKLFNYVGGTFIFLGVTYFIVDNWNDLNSFTRIFSTLGAAIAAFIIAIVFQQAKKFESACSAFFMISGLLLPIGLAVTLNTLDVTWRSDITNLFITGICFVVFLLAQLYSSRMVLLFFTILFASLFYFCTLDLITSRLNVYYYNLSTYEVMALGVSYIFLGYYLDINYKHILSGILYFFGGLFVLAESFTLGSNYAGYALTHWEIITGVLIALAFILSIPLRSRAFLYLGAIFLILYICDISAKFIHIFGHMGWPLILILIGLLLMLIGYLVFFIHRKINRIRLD